MVLNKFLQEQLLKVKNVNQKEQLRQQITQMVNEFFVKEKVTENSLKQLRSQILDLVSKFTSFNQSLPPASS